MTKKNILILENITSMLICKNMNTFYLIFEVVKKEQNTQNTASKVPIWTTDSLFYNYQSKLNESRY